MEQNIGNEGFSIEDIYRQMNISKVQLYRKVKALMGTNINEYILHTRLQKARYFLQHEDISVAEVAYKTGFSSPAISCCPRSVRMSRSGRPSRMRTH